MPLSYLGVLVCRTVGYNRASTKEKISRKGRNSVSDQLPIGSLLPHLLRDVCNITAFFSINRQVKLKIYLIILKNL